MRLLSKRLLILAVTVVVAIAVAVAVIAAKGLELQAARSPSGGRLNPSRGSIGVAVAVVVAAGTASSGAGPFSHGTFRSNVMSDKRYVGNSFIYLQTFFWRHVFAPKIGMRGSAQMRQRNEQACLPTKVTHNEGCSRV
jgi:hypothetical protein